MAAINFDQYFSYEARLASFQKTTKKRGSTTGGRGAAKALNWPHKQISATSLARAGFVFSPSPDSPDNTICFLCEKGLDGWEAGDDPVYEHVKHAPRCGWALVAAIEADIGDYAREDPNDPEMVEARKATFAGRWPHENKKGWKCKTKQLVEAGWKYTPTGESDDMATCAYCQLALDGWEQGDKPLDEHYNRSPDCPFFSLVSQYKALGKASNRGRSSRNSSVSAQSRGAAADISNPSDISAGFDDSVATGSSSAAQPGVKKPRAKRGTGAKAGRKKTKKEEPSALLDESSQMEEDAQLPKLGRGKKRSSDAIEESTMSLMGGPTLKKRASQLSVDDTIDNIAAHEDDSEMTDVSSVSYKKNGAPSSRSKPGRKRTSKLTSHASMASLRAPGGFLNDDEIERRLEADLEYHFTDDEEIAYDSDSTRNMAKASRTVTDSEAETTQIAKPKSLEHAMLETAVPEPNEIEVEDELQTLQAEMEVKESAPKRGRKAGVQKTLKQLKFKKVEAESELSESQKEEERVASADVSPIKRGRGRPSRESLASLLSAESGDTHTAKASVKRGRGRPSNESPDSTGADEDSEAASALAPKRRGRPSKASSTSQNAHDYTAVGRSKDAYAPVKRGRGRPAKKLVDITSTEQTETEVDDEFVEAPEPSEALSRLPKQSPLRAIFSPKEDALSLAPLPVLSPSQSPQSSDAENQPPASRAPAAGAAKRIILAPVAATPVQGSPSKRNVMTGLRSTTQWASASLEAIFGSPLGTPGKENDVDRFLKRGNELTSPERQMSVEEWIYFNAAEAEKKLKYECESLVNRFEMEGTRAIKVLEGLEVVEAES
ncbi:protein bir1 [Trichoderma asperellum]|uniref:Protein bir1 n=1 Tax=Trichoderma asperellum TaxID=101201 RepID=A0A6V8QTI9_TRIAP|nr:protein bir1 [Trichoderma asperellum]